MLARLSMLLDTTEIDTRQSTLLHGALMERLDTAYADFLHRQQFHPYSQYVERTPEGAVWHVQTLNALARQEITDRLAAGPDTFCLRHGEKRQIRILRKRLAVLPKADLLADFYGKAAERVCTVDFLTPAAFKQGGRYVILPDTRLLCQNLMLKYTAASDDVEMIDDEALEQIAAGAFVTRHRIRSQLFPLEGTAIPGFVGQVSFRCQGPETMARYLRLLLAFGEFSGVGLRTAMGMGAMRVLHTRGRDPACK